MAIAQRVRVILEDDLDGSPATVSFGLDDVSYEVDLSEEHAAQLRDTFSRRGSVRLAGSEAP